MPAESNAAHAKRIKDYLLLLSDAKFSGIGYLLDPDDPDQMRFINFYNEILGMRAHHTKGKFTQSN